MSAAEEPALKALVGARSAAGLVFFANGAVLVLEILSLRLVAPYMGLTLETSTAVIGFALAAIAMGAWLGGRAADVIPPRRTLGPVVLLAGVLVLFVGPAVRWTGEAARGGDVGSVLLIAAIAVFLPAALLSAVTPMVVKLRLATLAETGTVVGRMTAIGTAGALAATFLTGFVLVAAIPTSVILLVLGGSLVVLGALLTARLRGVRTTGGYLGVAVVGLAATGLSPQPCDVETAYHCARVVTDTHRPTGRTLQLDTLSHSYVDLADPTHLQFAYIRAIASVADVFRPSGHPVHALHLGGGGLTLPRYLAATRPGSDSLVLEIDGGVVELDKNELGFRPGDGVEVRTEDARVGLAAEPSDSRDLVIGDAFGGLAVPWHLTTRETVADVQRVLKPDGIYAVNIIDYPPLKFVRAEVATIADVFPYVTLLSWPSTLTQKGGGNLVVVASDAPLPLTAIRDRLVERAPEWDMLLDGTGGKDFAGGARILTDDFAPVDQLLTTVRQRR